MNLLSVLALQHLHFLPVHRGAHPDDPGSCFLGTGGLGVCPPGASVGGFTEGIVISTKRGSGAAPAGWRSGHHEIEPTSRPEREKSESIFG